MVAQPEGPLVVGVTLISAILAGEKKRPRRKVLKPERFQQDPTVPAEVMKWQHIGASVAASIPARAN